jgi:hypothetical protein
MLRAIRQGERLGWARRHRRLRGNGATSLSRIDGAAQAQSSRCAFVVCARRRASLQFFDHSATILQLWERGPFLPTSCCLARVPPS